MARAAAASTIAEAAHAASQALLSDRTESAGSAVDALVAGVLAIALLHPAALLGAGAILLGGTGESLLAIDGRARQPGLGAPRPRGFVEGAAIPSAARIGAPTLPGALVVAHAGRGSRTPTALARIALASADAVGGVSAELKASVLAFGREPGRFLHRGAVRDALLAAAPRSLGGALTAEDLDSLLPAVTAASRVDVGDREWAFTAWADELVGPAGTSESPPPEELSAVVADRRVEHDDLAILAVADALGAVAIACISLPRESVPLPGVGLHAPLLARPTMRAVTRLAPGAPLHLPTPIGLSRVRARPTAAATGIDLAIGVATSPFAHGELGRLAQVLAAAAVPGLVIDEVIARAIAAPSADERAARVASRASACAVLRDTRGAARALHVTR